MSQAPREALQQSQAGAVEQARGQPVLSLQILKHPPYLILGQHRWQSLWSLRTHGAIELTQGLIQYVLVQEYQRIECLILCAGSHVSFHSEIGEKLTDLSLSHVFWMALVVEEDKPLSSLQVGLIGADAVVADTNGIAYLFQEGRFLLLHVRVRLKNCMHVQYLMPG